MLWVGRCLRTGIKVQYGKFYMKKYEPVDQVLNAQLIADPWDITKEECQEFTMDDTSTILTELCRSVSYQ